MKRTGLVLSGLLMLAACERTPPPRPRGLVDREGKPVAAEPIAPAPADPSPTDLRQNEPAPNQLPDPFQEAAPDPGALAGPEDGPPAGANPTAAKAEPAGEARDLSKELAALLSQPASCLDMAEAAKRPGGKVTISVSASVVPSGRITRATVQSAGQPARALSCLEQSVTNSGLKGPVEGAPLNVTAEVNLEVVAAPAPAAPAPAPVPPPPPTYE